MSEQDTPEKRAYAIRLLCGDGWKTPMPMAEFAALVKSKTRGIPFDSAKVSRIESGDQKLSLADVTALAKVDPKKRGPAWIAFGLEVDSEAGFPTEQGKRKRGNGST